MLTEHIANGGRLASIIGFAELAKEKSAQADRSKLMRYLNEIEKSGERGANLVKQLLVYSRSASSRPREVNVQETISEAESLLRSSLPATINITSHLPTNKVTLHTDPEQLQQVLVNLCINAAEAMNSRGQINITAEVLDLKPIVCTSCLQHLSGEYISIKIEDTGPGIKGNAAELFTPFETSKLVGQGSGLGLSVVHGIVHEHKGHIRVSNRNKGGARFTVFLPTQHIPLPTPIGRNILLIEDDPSVAAYLTTFLDEHNFATTVAGLPNDALQTFMANPDYYDLVITDYLMPNTTGIELAEDLHALRPDIPIILTTGNANNISPQDLTSAGVTTVFEKPLNSDQLLAKIHGLLVTS